MNESATLETEVSNAFDAVKRDDLSQTSALVRHGEAVIQYVAPLVESDNEAVKIEAIALLAAIGGKDSTATIVNALDDDSSEIRRRAAQYLYNKISDGSSKVEFQSQLASGINKGKPDAASLLLAGYSNIDESTLSQQLSEQRLVKLYDEGPAVSASLPAKLALSLRGDSGARDKLMEEINTANIDVLEFMLQAIDSIDAPELLYALANKALTDERETSGGVPAGAEPARRVADKSVDVFVKRLSLDVPFELTPTRRYSKEQISQVQELIRDAIPQ